MRPSYSFVSIILLAIPVTALQTNPNQRNEPSRREIIGRIASTAGLLVVGGCTTQPAWSASAVQDSMNVDEFLRRGVDASGNMGVSSQAGKSRPETGVFLRDGSEISRNRKTGDLNAEIVVNANNGEKMAVFVSYSSPWPLGKKRNTVLYRKIRNISMIYVLQYYSSCLFVRSRSDLDSLINDVLPPPPPLSPSRPISFSAEGPFYDIECRNQKTSDGAFVQVTSNVGGKSISDIDNSFILENLLAPSGRFSFYGQPTDVKIKKSTTNGDYRIIDLSFSTLSQATQSELPRKAQLIATIPKGSSQAVVLIGSAPAGRWKKGSDQDIYSTIESFRAIAAPKSSLKLRRKERNSFTLDENGE